MRTIGYNPKLTQPAEVEKPVEVEEKPVEVEKTKRGKKPVEEAPAEVE